MCHPRQGCSVKFRLLVLKLSPANLEGSASFLGLPCPLHVGKLPRGR